MLIILKGHVSPETAYLVDDYPYGFRLRCKIRYWIEHKIGRGFRFVSQTTNPKNGDVWNTPKASTYASHGGCMLLNEEGHVKWTGLNEYKNGAETKAWADKYGDGVPESGQDALKKWVELKVAYDARPRNPGPSKVNVISEDFVSGE